MKTLQLTKYYAVETIPAGAARSLGVTVYRRDYGTHSFIEIQIDLIFWTTYVSLPVTAL